MRGETMRRIETAYRLLDMHLNDALVEAYWCGVQAQWAGMMDILTIWGL